MRQYKTSFHPLRHARILKNKFLASLLATFFTAAFSLADNIPPQLFSLRWIVESGRRLSKDVRYIDPDGGGTRSLEIIDAPQHGTVMIIGSSQLEYKSNSGYTGEDSFSFRMSDGIDYSNIVTNRIQVRDISDRAGSKVLIVVKDTLYTNLKTEVDRLKQDLINEGYTSEIIQWSSGSAANLWQLLKNHYENTSSWLAGALLIGNVPRPQITDYHPYYAANRTMYSDMGLWNMNFYQTSNAVNRADMRIWVGRFYTGSTTYGDEVTLIKRALDANHAARSGQSRLPHTAYWYHSWQNYNYGANLLDTWPSVCYTNEPSSDGHSSKTRFLSHRTDISEAGADALVAGGDLFMETSHGSATSYMNGAFNRDDLYRLIAQQRVCFIESCTSGAYDGIVNNHLFTRGGGLLFTVGGTDINYVGDFQIANNFNYAPAIRSLVKDGEAWGTALAQYYPFIGVSVTDRTVFYGDLSIAAMMAPSNAVPEIISFTKSPAKVYPGLPVTFTINVADANGATKENLAVSHKHRVEWFMNGYNAARNDPTHNTDDTQGAGWTNLTYTFPSVGTYKVRAEVVDEWQARGWREMDVQVLGNPEDQALLTVEASEGGSVTPAQPVMVSKSTPVEITAQADLGYKFAYWTEVTEGLADIEDINDPSTTVSIISNAIVKAVFTDEELGIMVSTNFVNVPEGGSAGFGVRLTAPPTNNVLVTLVYKTGSNKLTLPQYCQWFFTPADWHTWQMASIVSVEDDDMLEDEATFTLVADDLPDVEINARQIEKHLMLTVNSVTGGSVSLQGSYVVNRNTPVAIKATPAAGYGMVQWEVVSGDAAFDDATAAETFVTLAASSTIRPVFSLNVVGIETQPEFVTVPANGTTTFRVVLTAQPTGNVQVASARTGASGASINVAEGATLTFTPENWFVWQTVTLAAGNVSSNRETATIACTGDWGANATVSATEMRTDFGAAIDSDGDGISDIMEQFLGRNENVAETFATLPFVERFEFDTVLPGFVNGQNGWVANPSTNASVQGDDVYQGAGALKLASNSEDPVVVSHAFTNDADVVWLDTRIKVLAAPMPTEVPDVAAICCFNNRGQLVILDGARPNGQQMRVLENMEPLEENTWARITIRLDYKTQTWDVYLNGQLAAKNIGFCAPQNRLTALALSGCAGSIDDIYLGHLLPSDIGMPESWLIEKFGHTLYGPNDDPDGDGMTNREEYLAGTDPNDRNSRLDFTDLDQVLEGTFEVSWKSVAGRTYSLHSSTNLLTGFDRKMMSGIRATPPVNRFNDTIESEVQKFYRVTVDVP